MATAGALAPRSHLGRLGATARARRRGELEQYEPESSGTHDAFDRAELVFPLDLEKQYRAYQLIQQYHRYLGPLGTSKYQLVVLTRYLD